MRNNACTIILNGHGGFSKREKLIDVSETNYNIVFLCKMNGLATNTSHNFLLHSLVRNQDEAWNMFENVKSTYFANKAAQKLSFDMNDQHTHIIYEHAMKNASNVVDVNNLVDFDNERFCEREVTFDTTEWQWSGIILIEYDKKQITDDVSNAHQVENYQYNCAIALSANNLIHLRVGARAEQDAILKLSEILVTVLPNLKIPVSYHQDGKVDIVPMPFIPTDRINIKEYIAANYSSIFDLQNDIYHEMEIPGDANIIFDMCREEV